MNIHSFGTVGPNDWPLACPAKFKIYGPAADAYRAAFGRAPTFLSQGAAEKVLRKLWRQYRADQERGNANR